MENKNRKTKKRLLKLLFIVVLIALIVGIIGHCHGGNDDDMAYNGNDNAIEEYNDNESYEEDIYSSQIDEDGEYTTANDVAEYIHTYHKLPSNYMLDSEAKEKGWKSNECPADYGIMIGGRPFMNHEGLLPERNDYYECDVDYDGIARGKKRLIFTKGGTVYYTDDHYASFELLYTEE